MKTPIAQDTLPTKLHPTGALQQARRIIKLYKAQAKVNQKIGKLYAQAERIRAELAYYETDWR